MSITIYDDNERPKISGSGPIATAPTPSKGKLWVDGSMIYEGRWIGNFDNGGVTSVKDLLRTNHSTFDANSDFDLEIKFKQTPDLVDFTGLFCQGVGVNIAARGLWIERNLASNGYEVIFYQGTSKRNFITPILVDNTWHRLRVVQVSKIATISINDVVVGSINNTGWTVNPPQAINIGSLTLEQGRCLTGQISNVTLKTSVGGFIYDFSEGTGTTIFDKSGNSNNATLTDSTPFTFWQLAWVPLLSDNIAGYGSLTNAPAPTEALRNKIFIETGDPLYATGRVYQYKYVFKSGGADSVNAGKPSTVYDYLLPTLDFKVELLFAAVPPASTKNLIALSNQFAIQINSAGVINFFVGGTGKSVIDFSLSATLTYYKLVFEKIGGEVFITINGIRYGAYTGFGTSVTTNPLSMLVGDMTCFCEKISYYGGDGVLLDEYNFNDTTKWDGSLNGLSLYNQPFTVTDSSPTGVRVVDLVPIDFPNDLVGVGTLASAPAPSVALLGKKYEQTDDGAYPLGRIWKYRSIMRNDGLDLVTIDNDLINNNLVPGVNEFTIRFKVKFNTLTPIAHYLFTKGENSEMAIDQQFACFVRTDTSKNIYLRVGAVESIAPFVATTGVWYDIIVSVSTANVRSFINGVTYNNSSRTGVFTSPHPLKIAGYAANSIYNAQMDTMDWEFFTGATLTPSTADLTRIATYRLDEPANTTTIYDSTSGGRALVTDASPVGALGNIVLVPDQF